MSKIRTALEIYLCKVISEQMLEAAIKNPEEFILFIESFVLEDLQSYTTPELLQEVEAISGGLFSIDTDLIPIMKKLTPIPQHVIALGD